MRFDLDSGRDQPPLYQQLAAAVESFIATDGLQPGDMLPSETALATDNRLSRATVSKALDKLVDRGIVTRRQGKGTFVAAAPMERKLPELTSFSEHVFGLGLTPGNTLLSYEAYGPHDLNRPESEFSVDEPVVCIERIRTVEAKPVGLHRILISQDIADEVGINEQRAASEKFSFYRSLREANVFIVESDESLCAINADSRDAELLGVETGTALIEVTRISRGSDGRLIECVRARYLGSRYRYHISFQPSEQGGARNESKTHNTRSGGGLYRPANGL